MLTGGCLPVGLTAARALVRWLVPVHVAARALVTPNPQPHASRSAPGEAHLAKWMGICPMLLAIETSAPCSSSTFTTASLCEPPTAL